MLIFFAEKFLVNLKLTQRSVGAQKRRKVIGLDWNQDKELHSKKEQKAS